MLAIVVINQMVIIASTFFSPKIQPPNLEARKPGQADLPPYSPDWVKWEIPNQEIDIQSIGRNKIQNLIKVENGTFTQSDVDGFEWKSTEEFKNTKEFERGRDMTSYYIDVLGKDGWRFSEEVKQATISGIAIDGPKGNSFSMVKAISGKFQLFAMSSQRDNETCPCKVTHRVFITNPILIQEIIE